MREIGSEKSRALNIIRGQQAISADPDVVLTTLLGSCVAACIRDPIAKIGGMNHFLLPGDRESASERQAVHAMELLVNALLGRGASRGQLEAKVFGGAATMQGLTDIGSLNAEFAVAFLRREGINIIGQCLGGRSGRRIQYWPVSGRARRVFMEPADFQIPTISPPIVSPQTSIAGSLELF